MHRIIINLVFICGYFVFFLSSNNSSFSKADIVSVASDVSDNVGTAALHKTITEHESNVKIAPTPTLESPDTADTVVIVGGGAGGAAAAVKLPTSVETSLPGVSDTSQLSVSEAQSDGTMSVADKQMTEETTTVPELVKPTIRDDGSMGSYSDGGNDETRLPTLDDSSTLSPTPSITVEQQYTWSPLDSNPDAEGTVQSVLPTPPSPSPPPLNQENAQAVPQAGGVDEAVKQEPDVGASTAGSDAGTVLPQSGGASTVDGQQQAAGVGNGQQSVEVDTQKPGSNDQIPVDKAEVFSIDLDQAHKVLPDLPTGMGGMAVEPNFVGESKPSVSTGVDSSNPGDVKVGDQAGQEEATTPGANTGTEDEFPTFDKWSVQYLAEQEKQKIEKEQEQAVKPGGVLQQKKLRQNFAAETCGAKVVSSNAEAENINHLLNGNPDEYMISPCKAKKWFVVELCEPVQIHKVELGTLELFSSQPKSFRVAASQRFPAKDWIQLGQFEMTADRAVQSFPTRINEEFVKFLRVEMLEHHGKEHYCPLTTLRVLGVDMALDDDDDHDSADVEGHEASHGDGEEKSADGAESLYNKAKDTVVKIIQKVLYKGEKEEEASIQSENATTETGKSDEQSLQADTTTTPCPIRDTDKTTTEVPPVGVIPPPHIEEVKAPPQPASPDSAPTPSTTPNIVTKLGETEQLPADTTPPVVVKLDPGDQVEGHAQHRPARACAESDRLLRYRHLLGLRQLTPLPFCLVGQAAVSKPKVNSAPDVTSQQQAAGGQGQTAVGDKQADAVMEAEDPVEIKVDTNKEAQSQHPNEDPTASMTASQVDAAPSEVPSQPPAETQQAGADSLSIEKPSVDPSDATLGDNTLASQLEVSTTADHVATVTISESVLKPSSVAADNEGSTHQATQTPDILIDQSLGMQQSTPDLSQTNIPEVSPSPTAGFDNGAKVHTVTPVSLASSEGKGQDVTPTEAEVRESSSSDQTTTNNTEAASQTNASQKPLETASVNVSQPAKPRPTGARPAGDLVKIPVMPSSKRDASVLKLNNRIVALEQNVSMTKKYLEELSRAFKQQNEEMMRLANKTDSRISSLVAWSNERDMIQQAAIAVLEQKVSNLTATVELLNIKMESMAEELWKGQLLLGVMQLLAFLWLIMNTAATSSLRASIQHTLPSHTSGVDEGSKDVSHSPASLSHTTQEGKGARSGVVADRMLHRRSSDTGPTGGLADISDQMLAKQSSETSLLNAINSEGASKELFSQNSKKKKKKKQRQSQCGDSTSPEAVVSDDKPAQSTSFSTPAGVLFGTSSNINSSVGRVGHPNMQESDLTWADMKENSPVGKGKFMWTENVSQPQGYHVSGAQHSQPVSVFTGASYCGYGTSPLSVMTGGRSSPYHSALPSGPTPLHDLSNSPPFHRSLSSSPLNIPHQQRFSPPSAWTRSPEFKLPAYRRSKIRRISETDEAAHDSRDITRSHQPHARRTIAIAETRRRRQPKSDFINPTPGEEFFLVRNYLSENRFKFPASPSKDNRARSHRPAEGDVLLTGHSPGDNLGELKPPGESAFMPHEQMVVTNVVTTGLPPRPQGSSRKMCEASNSVRFASNIPSFIPLHQCSSVPLSLSNMGITVRPEVAQPGDQTGQSRTQRETLRTTYAVDKRSNSTLPLISLSEHNNSCSQKVASESESEPTPGINGCAGSGKKAAHKGHRRQGSFPLDQHQQTPDTSKARKSRQGSFHETSRSAGKSDGSPQSPPSGVSGQQQGGSKMKKGSSNGQGKRGGPRPGSSYTATNIHR